MPHYIGFIVGGVLFLLVSVLVAYFRPCKSLIMNLSFGYHFMLCGILDIGIGLWIEDFSFSTETLATLFVSTNFQKCYMDCKPTHDDFSEQCCDQDSMIRTH